MVVSAPAIVVVAVAAFSRMRRHHYSAAAVVVVGAAAGAAAAVRFRSRPAGRCSSHRPSRADRIRADRSHNRNTADRTVGRSLHTAAVPAAHTPDHMIAVAVAVAAAGVAAVRDRRTAADVPWRGGGRYRLSVQQSHTHRARSVVEQYVRIAPLSGGTCSL